MIYQWYPGHMSKAKRQIEADLRLVDVIIELVDARIPLSSKNPEIDRMAGNKPRIVLLNKADLADERRTKEFVTYFQRAGVSAIPVNAKTGMNGKRILTEITNACQKKLERDRKRGIIGRPLKAMILGIPNVGKSTVINALVGKNCTITGNKPGVTKGKQWIRLSKDIELMDTPGILWPKFDDQRVGLFIALIGSINEDILDIRELAIELLSFLAKQYKGMVAAKYGIEETEDGYEALIAVAKKRGCLRKAGAVDEERAAGIVMDEFRSGKLGRITLDSCENEQSLSAEKEEALMSSEEKGEA